MNNFFVFPEPDARLLCRFKNSWIGECLVPIMVIGA